MTNTSCVEHERNGELLIELHCCKRNVCDATDGRPKSVQDQKSDM